MSNDTANPVTGAESEDSAVEYLLSPAEAPKEEQAEEAVIEAAEQPAEDAQAEPEAPGTEPDADEAEPEQVEAEPSETFTVKVNGEEMEVTRDELVKGYQLEADYRRKTANLSDDRKAVEIEKAALEQAKQELEAKRLEALSMTDEAEPDWVKLIEEDPIGAFEQRAKWDARQKQKAEAKQQLEAMQEQQKREVATREWNTLMEKVPEWKDPKAFEAATTEINETAVHYGFSQQEVANNLDHRVLLVMRDAAEYRKMTAAKPEIEKKVSAAPKAMKPGATRSKTSVEAESRQKLRENLQRNPDSAEAAIAYLTGG